MLDRRKLIQDSLKIVALAPVASAAVFAFAEDKKKAAPKKADAKKPAAKKTETKQADVIMVDAKDDPVAGALKYTDNGATATRADKMGVKGADQTCANCQLYVPSGKGAYGKCTMLSSGMVAEKGWCSSWIKKS